MKQFDLFRKLLIVSFLCAAGAAKAQAPVQPAAFGYLGTSGYSNWYANYVGLRVEVNSPAVIAGNKNYTVTNDGSGATGVWGGAVTAPIANVPIFMDTTSDSFGCTAFSAADMATIAATPGGKIVVLWRGPIVGACDFACKALDAQNAGACAVVIINEYPGQGPIPMGAGTTCTGQTIPIFMIGNLDGIAISAQYRAGVQVRMTLTTWGQNLNNDLGFVPGGIAGWHDYAIPQSQLVANGNPWTYMGMDGAFIANYGTHDATNVSVKDSLTFTPTGGSATQIHVDQSGVLPLFSVADSIYTFYAPAPYTLPAETTTGEYDLTYIIKQDSINQFPPDNTMTYSFFSTDSVFSKGRYDFANPIPQPISYSYLFFNGGNEFVWGPMYYVANGGSYVSSIQYSIATSIPTGGTTHSPLTSAGSNNVYLFQWIDGYTDPGSGITYAKDGLVQDGELVLVSLGIKTYNTTTEPSDTGEGLLTINTMGDTGNANPPYFPALNANSWYYVAIDVPGTTALPLGMGADGVLNPYTRQYGFFNYANNDTAMEYSSMLFGGDKDSIEDLPAGYNLPCPGIAPSNNFSLDSFFYNPLIGEIPSVAVIVTTTPPNAVKQVSKPFANVSIYPNPAKDVLNVSINLQQQAKTVTYEIIDGLARFVSKEYHYNVLNEVDAISTSTLIPGNYYLIITADGKIMSKRFTVLK